MPIRLPDPFTHPGIAPGFLTADLIDNEPHIQDSLPNGSVLEVITSSQFWGINITYPELLKEEYITLSSHINKAKASDGVILVVLPQYFNMRVSSDTDTMMITAGQSGSSLEITNYNDSGKPYVGDLFKIKGQPKVYKITSVDREGSKLTLGLYPKLANVTTGSEKPEFNDIQFHMKMVNRTGIVEKMNADGLFEDVSLVLREAL